MRTVLKRWETRIVTARTSLAPSVRPPDGPLAAAAKRSLTACSVCASSAAVGDAEAPQVDPVHRPAPYLRLVEAAQQLAQRHLPRAVLAHGSDDAARRQLERDLVQHHGVGSRVAERHPFQGDAALEALGH